MAYIESITVPEEHIQNVFGQYDKNIKNIEKAYKVTIVLRDDSLRIVGVEENVKRAVSVVEQMINLSKNGNEISEQEINYAVSLTKNKESDVSAISELDNDINIICHTINGKPVKAKTLGQKKYVDAIDNNMIVFGTGPAGTGKTYLAMAKAITAFKNNEVNRIILTRPAIEAGEKLGFLPGDLQSKVDPYLRPLYDALYEIMGAESFMKNMEKGLIEVAPLAYMRGRTLDNAYIVLDEAQNTTPAQMKMFLTRIGFGSKAIITGDLSQKDLSTVLMLMLMVFLIVGTLNLGSHQLKLQISSAVATKRKTNNSKRGLNLIVQASRNFYLQNLWFPITTVTGLDHIHELVAVFGLK